MRANDRMRLASTSKAFSGAVALSLVSKGALSLNDTIGERLPSLPDAWSEVTLRQLLNHTSGLPDFTEDPDFLAALQASPEDAPRPRKLLSFVEDEPLRFGRGGRSDPPGPGKNSAGLRIFRYETRCGTAWGHTGNYPGYTQFLAASPNGNRSVTVSVNEQLSPVQGAPGVSRPIARANATSSATE